MRGTARAEGGGVPGRLHSRMSCRGGSGRRCRESICSLVAGAGAVTVGSGLFGLPHFTGDIPPAPRPAANKVEPCRDRASSRRRAYQLSCKTVLPPAADATRAGAGIAAG